MMPLSLIYLIACLEGFTTLAIQMIILRLAIPITGSSIVVTSIFLGVILLALSFGYWYGGKISEDAKGKMQDVKGYAKTLTKFLGTCLIVSGLWYLLLVIPFQRDILQRMMSHLFYEGALFAVAILLFFVPIFLASQTVPMLTELIPIESKGRSAGLIFFISTIGSFLGSICTTLLLFPRLGVMKTGILVSVVLIILGLLSYYGSGLQRFQKKQKLSFFLVCIVLIFAACYLVSNTTNSDFLASYDSSYQEIIVRNYNREGKPVRIFHTNRSFASGFDPATKQSPFDYIRHMVDQTKVLKSKRILVIGAAGFVYPYEVSQFDFVERVDAIDIDPKVKQFAESYLLQEQLSSKVHFIPESARYAVRRLAQQGKRYDLIIVDAFLGRSVPAELVTQEFMQDIMKVSENKQIMRNMILDNTLLSIFAKKFLATAQSVFGEVWTYDVMEKEHRPVGSTTNIMITSFGNDAYKMIEKRTVSAETVYRDDKNSAEIDAIAVLQ